MQYESLNLFVPLKHPPKQLAYTEHPQIESTAVLDVQTTGDILLVNYTTILIFMGVLFTPPGVYLNSIKYFTCMWCISNNLDSMTSVLQLILCLYPPQQGLTPSRGDANCSCQANINHLPTTSTAICKLHHSADAKMQRELKAVSTLQTRFNAHSM